MIYKSDSDQRHPARPRPLADAPLWQPGAAQVAASQLTAYTQRFGLPRENYQALHRWSVAEPARFWETVWQFCEVQAGAPHHAVLEDAERFPGARWFPGSRLNFAENLLRHRDERTALVGLLENGERRALSYAGLYREVERVAGALHGWGVGPGDRVAGYLPNIIEAVVAMLATTSIGAVWSSCSPDFGLQGALERFGQIEPKVLFAADGYHYNGKRIATGERVRELHAALDSVQQLVWVSVLETDPGAGHMEDAVRFETLAAATPLEFAQLPFDHPLYILYSSGTTGAPKCIVHGAGGTLLQHLKEHRLHVDIDRDDVLFYFTTCGWMMWNWLVSGLASGCTVVLYDGAPLANAGRVLLDAIDAEGISVFGASAKFFAALEQQRLAPARSHRLQRLRTILSTGSPLAPASFDYIYRDFKADVLLGSISGGTDIVSCFALSNPWSPVHRGQLQGPGLGMAVAIWDETGRPLASGKGELVCTQPFPSCPIGFWNDGDGQRFHQAYFARFAQCWAHGDYAELTAEGGLIIHGRSDAVLNPGGVRIGTAEIYRQLDGFDEITDSVVIGQDWQDDVRVVLFVVLRETLALDDALRERIRQAIRRNTTPRHVPARIVQVADIPRTLSGKTVELAVRAVVHGLAVKNREALANPAALDLFRELPELRT